MRGWQKHCMHLKTSSVGCKLTLWWYEHPLQSDQSWRTLHQSTDLLCTHPKLGKMVSKNDHWIIRYHKTMLNYGAFLKHMQVDNPIVAMEYTIYCFRLQVYLQFFGNWCSLLFLANNVLVWAILIPAKYRQIKLPRRFLQQLWQLASSATSSYTQQKLTGLCAKGTCSEESCPANSLNVYNGLKQLPKMSFHLDKTLESQEKISVNK